MNNLCKCMCHLSEIATGKEDCRDCCEPKPTPPEQCKPNGNNVNQNGNTEQSAQCKCHCHALENFGWDKEVENCSHCTPEQLGQCGHFCHKGIERTSADTPWCEHCRPNKLSFEDYIELSLITKPHLREKLKKAEEELEQSEPKLPKVTKPFNAEKMVAQANKINEPPEWEEQFDAIIYKYNREPIIHEFGIEKQMTDRLKNFISQLLKDQRKKDREQVEQLKVKSGCVLHKKSFVLCQNCERKMAENNKIDKVLSILSQEDTGGEA